MALDIVAQDIIIDETAGIQVEDDDIDPSDPLYSGNLTLQYLLTLGTALEVAFKEDFVQATGDPGEIITSILLTQNLDGDLFSPTDGVLTDIRTVDGKYVWLFQDSTDPNVVIGVIGTDDPNIEPDEGGALAFSFGLDPTSSTNADLYLVEYVPLQHPLGGDSNPDDRIDLTDMVFASIAGTTEISFSGQNAAPGNHDFYLINSPDDAAKQLLVIGLNGGTANVSTQGFGINNQSINPNETLQVDFVTGGDLNAGTSSQIQYDNHLDDITEAGFTINQITPSNPNKRVDVTIKAFDNTFDEQSSDFFNGTVTTSVDIVSVKLTGASGLAATIIADGDYVTASGTIHVSGLDGTGNAVTITGLDNITTVDITTASQMDRLTVTGVDANEGCDITEFHFNATTTNAHTEEVGSLINFDDDGPSISTTGIVQDLTVDESNFAGDASHSFAANFAPVPGADGDDVTYALSIGNLDSGLVDTLTSTPVTLSVVGGVVIGENGNGDEVFRVSVDAATGVVTLDQSRSVVHPDHNSSDESISLAAGIIVLTATITDGDGDTAAAPLEIGDHLIFKDDGPSITADGTEPTITVDETNLGDNSESFSAAFTSNAGADGDAISYVLDINQVTNDSGLTDTLTGEAVLLSVNGAGAVEGRTAGTDDLVFTVSVSAAGLVTLDQVRAVIHFPDSGPDQATTLASDDLITLTATITDGDGDQDDDTVNIGTSLIFKDDAPTITVPFDGDASGGGSDGTHEILANTAGATASGAFKYDIGADARPALYYDATHSDFVDSNGDVSDGVQIALTGSITGGGGGNLITSDVTLTSETDLLATFNFTFTYDADPAAGEQTGTGGGTLVFDKDDGTYTITLTDALEGFSFDLLHTSELLAKVPTSNTGHPKIVQEKLADDFYVQFTGNLINKANPFSLTGNGQGGSGDTVFDGAPPHEMVSNNNETWVSATQSTNGVAGDTIQKGELLTLRFFDSDVGIASEVTTPTATAGTMAIKFDGIGNSEDLMLILDLIDDKGTASTADDVSITRAMYVSNSDLFRTGNVPDPYGSQFTLDNNDGLVIIEQNDYNATGEHYLLQSVQIMQSGNGITGTAIDLEGATGVASTGTTGFDAVDNDVLKITDIAFSTTVTETPSADLTFAFQVADADGDITDVQQILVDVG
ncbi:MAG: hypothetical protein E5Y31_03440 [Mesorhizobium sp.]|nr:MAG: hypothetical protein E5Y31_03440 [Mesorhizobium sp.]